MLLGVFLKQIDINIKRPYCVLFFIVSDTLNEANRPRPLPFNSEQHKVLNSELKYLYTALTRARVNVWIYDEDGEAAGPMCDYFKALKLVTVIRPGNLSGGG